MSFSKIYSKLMGLLEDIFYKIKNTMNLLINQVFSSLKWHLMLIVLLKMQKKLKMDDSLSIYCLKRRRC